MDTAQVSQGTGRGMRQTLREPGTKVILPTGETIPRYHHLRRVQIPGFPATREPLPEVRRFRNEYFVVGTMA